MSNNEQDSGQQLPFDMRQVLAAILARSSGVDLSSALGDSYLAKISGQYSPERRLSEGELFERYAPEFLYIAQNESPDSWKSRAASSISQGVPAYVVKENFRQELMNSPDAFGMSTSKEIDDFVDSLAKSYGIVRTQALEQEQRKDPFQKAGYPGADEWYSPEQIASMGAAGFREIYSKAGPDSDVNKEIEKLTRKYIADKAALSKRLAEQPQVEAGPPPVSATERERNWAEGGRESSPYNRGEQRRRALEERTLSEYDKLVERHNKALAGGSTGGGGRNRQSRPLDPEQTQAALDAFVEKNPWVTSASREMPKKGGAEKTQKRSKGDAAGMLDFMYQRHKEFLSNKPGGQAYADKAAKMYFGDIEDSLREQGRDPLMDALVQAAIVNRMMRGNK